MGSELAVPSGAFVESLERNNSKIKHDRAAAIAELAYVQYRRVLEDLELEARGLERAAESLLDMSPNNATNIIVVSDFNAQQFVNKDLEIGIKIRNTQIKLDVARNRFNFLFAGKDGRPVEPTVVMEAEVS